MAGKYGIDTGTNNLRIYQGGHGLVIYEKNMIAIQKKKEVVAVGNDAYEMYERTPYSIAIHKPVKQGIISDITNLNKINEAMLKKAGCSGGFVRNNTFYIAVPSDITEVEKRAYYDLISRSIYNTHNVYVVEKPIAAAIGEGIPVNSYRGYMIVDMGAGSTEISVISSGGIVVSQLLHEGGNTINDTIISLIKKRHHLVVGDKTAELLKYELAASFPGSTAKKRVYGRDTITGLPAEAEIEASLVFDSLKRYFNNVYIAIRNILEKIPPEISIHVRERGIYFTGGTSLIPDVNRLFSQALHIHVMVSAKPLESTSKGLAMIIEHPLDYKNVIYSLRSANFD